MPPSSRVFLLTGPSGAGKTAKIVDLFLGAGGGAPGRDALLLLPDRAAAGSIRLRILDTSKNRGVLDGGITTFEHLAASLLGTRLDASAAPEEESLLLLALAPTFPEAVGKRAGSPRFRGSFLRWVADLREAGIDGAEIRALLAAIPGAEERLLLLADSFDRLGAAERERGLLFREELPLRAARALAEGRLPAPRAELLLVDGFHHFSPARLELLAELARRIPETWVTLPSPEGSEAWTAGMLERSHSAIVERLAPEPVHLAGGTALPDPVFLGGSDRREEIERIARLILAHSADEGRRFSDFLVLFREADPYREILAVVFRAFGVPYRGRFQIDAASTAPGRSLLDSARLGIEGLTRGSVDAFLKNRMFAVDPDLADRIVRSWKGTPDPPSGEALFREIEARDRGLATERIEPLLRFVRETEVARGAAAVRALRDSWLEWIEPSIDASAFPGEDLAAAGAALGRLTDLLDRFASRVDGEAALRDLPAREILALLADEVGRARVSFVEGEGGVRVDDFRHGQNLRAPVVFVAGLEAGLCPRGFDPGSFWNESDRERLGATGQFRIADRALHADEERYLFHRALTRAVDRLYLSAAAFRPDGKASPESPFRIEIRREKVAHAGADLGPVERFQTPAAIRTTGDLLPFLASRADPAERDRAGIALAAAVLAKTGTVSPAPPRSFREPVRLAGTRAFRAWLAGRNEFSVTELEDFQACPYRYFSKHVLSLGEPDEETEFAFPIVVEGEVLHRVLEETAAGELPIGDLVRRALEEARGSYPEHLGHRLAGEDLAASLASLVEEDLAFRMEHGWTPREFEFRFGAAAKRPLRLDEGVSIRGRIDRVDFSSEGDVLVVDYKRSSVAKVETARALEEGRNLALPLYLVAASRLLGGRPAGAFLLGLRKRGRGGFFDRSLAPRGIVPEETRGLAAAALDAEAFRETIESASARAKQAADEIRAGDFPVEPADAKVCDRLHCPYRDLCRVVLAAMDEEEGE